MKMRVRNARYQDVHHIAQVLIASAEKQDYLRLPPIEEPHIYNYLNFHIARGEVLIAIASNDKNSALAGVVVMEPMAFPWNTAYRVYATSLIAVHPNYRIQGAAEALIREMVAIGRRDNVAMIVRPTPGIDSGLDGEQLLKAGMSELSGVYCYQPPLPDLPMENAAE